jgi:hypothetical protein
MQHPPPPSVAGIVQKQYAARLRPRALPGAPQTLYSGPTTLQGQSGTLTLTFTPDAPTPPPPPPLGQITSVTTWNAQPLSAGRGGDFVLVNGKGFGAVKGTVTVAGLFVPTAELHRWTDGQLAFFLPMNTGPDLSGPILITPSPTGGFPPAAITSPFAFTLAGTGPAPPPPPADPAIKGYLDGNSSPRTYFPEGVPVRVVGVGFGSAPGTLILSGAPFAFTAWSDTEVDFAAPVVIPPGSTVSTSPWQTVGIVRSDNKRYTDQWGIKLQRPLIPANATDDADPLPLPWASEPPVWVETQPFSVGGRYFDLQVRIEPSAGIAPDPPPTPLPPVVTAPVIAGGHYWTLEVTPVPVAGGPPAGGAKP